MKALLIIDIQNDYFDGGAMPLVGSSIALKNAQHILEKFRQEQLPVIMIQHIASRPEAGFFLANTNGAKIHPDITPLDNEKVIIKHFPNSFHETELNEYLNDKGIDELIICGMMTHMCIDATTRAAKDIGYNCTLIGDACATRNLEIFGEKVNAEEVQKSFLAALDYFYANVITTDNYLKNNQ